MVQPTNVASREDRLILGDNTDQRALTSARFQHIATMLRDMQSDLAAERHDELRHILEWLEDCNLGVGGLSPQALRWNVERRDGRPQLNAEVLLSAFLASRNMGSKGRDDFGVDS